MLAPSLLSLTLGSQVRGKCRGETMQEWSRVKAGSREVSVQGLEGSGAGRWSGGGRDSLWPAGL